MIDCPLCHEGQLVETDDEFYCPACGMHERPKDIPVGSVVNWNWDDFRP